MKTLAIKKQLTRFGLNPTDWLVHIKNNKTAILMHNTVEDFVLIGKMNASAEISNLQMMSF